jgi:hypothetical protein
MIEMNIKERQYDDRLQKMFAPGERRGFFLESESSSPLLRLWL